MPSRRPQNIRTSQREVRAAKMREQISKLREDGETLAEIGTVLGITAQNVHHHLMKAIELANAETSFNVAEWRKKDLAIIELMLAVWIPRATIGDDPQAAGVVYKFLERRCKLLGTDMPTSSNVNISGSNVRMPATKEEAYRQLMALIRKPGESENN